MPGPTPRNPRPYRAAWQEAAQAARAAGVRLYAPGWPAFLAAAGARYGLTPDALDRYGKGCPAAHLPAASAPAEGVAP